MHMDSKLGLRGPALQPFTVNGTHTGCAGGGCSGTCLALDTLGWTAKWPMFKRGSEPLNASRMCKTLNAFSISA